MTSPDSAPLPLDTHYRRKFFQFNPNIDSGTLLQIGVILVGMIAAYGAYTSDKAADRARMTAIEKDVTDNKGTVKEAVTDLRADVKEVQKSLIEVNQSLAILRARPSVPTK